MSRHLIIKALHRDESFLSQGIERLIRTLKAENQQVEVRDLYDLDFNPVLTTFDFESVKTGNIPEDIEREQTYINRSDFIWIVYPIWWASMPAILKGYIDRIFLSGFAYRMEGDYPKGLLVDKQVIILNSMGMSHEDYKKDGVFDALEITTDKGIFEFSGMHVLAHKYFSSIMSADDEKRERYSQEIENLVNSVVSRDEEKKIRKERKVA